GAERHPNSIQRVMSFRGSADMQTWDGDRWCTNALHDGPSIEDRWLTIPAKVWHRPVIDPRSDWVVVSFHTATDAELIEERALDDEHPDDSGFQQPYAGRTAR